MTGTPRTHGGSCPLAGQERGDVPEHRRGSRYTTLSMRIDLADGACLSVDDAVAKIEGGGDVVVCCEMTARGVLARFGCDEPYIDGQIALALG